MACISFIFFYYELLFRRRPDVTVNVIFVSSERVCVCVLHSMRLSGLGARVRETW